MLKRITTALVAALSISAPGMAWSEATQLDASHQHLWDTMESKGVWTFVNPERACQDPEKDLDGAYFYSHAEGRPILVVCQDNRQNPSTDEVAWTANDYDTIRHEGMHFLQDCLDGSIDMELVPYFDGANGAVPGDYDHADIIQRLGPDLAVRIAVFYTEKLNASAHVVRLEHEAFFVAANIEPHIIAAAIDKHCPVR